ncbi:hypothetical protein FEM48_ZijujUnG0025100 [Ziziphus jujuba var. spinosa]|uniref:Phosphotransferase n=1 Tax=Ziziphus jujuba var. spinosa TaxID=714518 RepID=A0A978U9R3_ZIZJJ|nr:hypothetical protein FEM48_ZijujUnG0025100 [Ziziphus jujuba var. spinosa]
MAVEMHAGLASEGGSKLKMLLTFVDTLPNGRCNVIPQESSNSIKDWKFCNVIPQESSNSIKDWKFDFIAYRGFFLDGLILGNTDAHDWSEKGTYYALDLGGTNFRVLRVQLGGGRSSILDNDVKRQPIPQHLMTSTSEDLFDFIASSLKEFVDQEGDAESSVDRRRELGFTFSFPVKQISVSSGTLIKWTKGFAIRDMVGMEVSGCLEQAMTRKGLNMKVAALVNDSVGTLALGHYHDADTVAAVIIGTGTNACYMERTDAIIKCQGLLTTSGGMVVNMEWGNFWSAHLPRTTYDIDLDADSPNPNYQGFEKMISGMYLGDIVRRVILRMSEEADIFGPVSSKLSMPFILSLSAFLVKLCCFRTPLMAAMHEDDSPELTEVGRILSDILEVRKLVVKVCDVVTRRAARLAAAGIAGILKKIGRDGSGGKTPGRSRSDNRIRRTVVAVEGGLYTSYTMFREYLHEALNEILGEEVSQHVFLKVTEDGSGIGAALLAASQSSNSVDRDVIDGKLLGNLISLFVCGHMNM